MPSKFSSRLFHLLSTSRIIPLTTVIVNLKVLSISTSIPWSFNEESNIQGHF